MYLQPDELSKDWGDIDNAPWRDWLAAQPSSIWHEVTFRQNFYPSQRNTQNIMFVYADRDPVQGRQEFYVRYYPRSEEACDMIARLVEAIRTRVHVPTLRLGMLIITKLFARHEIYPHVDGRDVYNRNTRRFYIGLSHNDEDHNAGIMSVDDGRIARSPEPNARLIELNGLILHGARNDTDQDRIFMIIDLIDPKDVIGYQVFEEGIVIPAWTNL